MVGTNGDVRVEKLDDAWAVTSNGRVLGSGFATMAKAWEWIDRNEVHELFLTSASAERFGELHLAKSKIS